MRLFPVTKFHHIRQTLNTDPSLYLFCPFSNTSLIAALALRDPPSLGPLDGSVFLPPAPGTAVGPDRLARRACTASMNSRLKASAMRSSAAWSLLRSPLAKCAGECEPSP